MRMSLLVFGQDTNHIHSRRIDDAGKAIHVRSYFRTACERACLLVVLPIMLANGSGSFCRDNENRH